MLSKYFAAVMGSFFFFAAMLVSNGRTVILLHNLHWAIRGYFSPKGLKGRKEGVEGPLIPVKVKNEAVRPTG